MFCQAGVDEVEHFCLEVRNIKTLRVGSYELWRQFRIHRLEAQNRVGQAVGRLLGKKTYRWKLRGLARRSQ